MTGEDLYQVWYDSMLSEGVSTDKYEELEPVEMNAWDKVAQAAKTTTDDTYDGPDVNG